MDGVAHRLALGRRERRAAETKPVDDAPPAARPSRPRADPAGRSGGGRDPPAPTAHAADQVHPSWLLRVAAVGLLALLMLALVAIVLSLV